MMLRKANTITEFVMFCTYGHVRSTTSATSLGFWVDEMSTYTKITQFDRSPFVQQNIRRLHVWNEKNKTKKLRELHPQNNLSMHHLSIIALDFVAQRSIMWPYDDKCLCIGSLTQHALIFTSCRQRQFDLGSLSYLFSATPAPWLNSPIVCAPPPPLRLSRVTRAQASIFQCNEAFCIRWSDPEVLKNLPTSQSWLIVVETL